MRGTDLRTDTLQALRRLREAPHLKEAAVLEEQRIAEVDPAVRALVDDFYFDADRDASLSRFLASGFPADVIDTIRHYFGDRKDIVICEIGAGHGFLSAALLDAGYTDVSLVEPAGEHITGTGFIRDQPNYRSLRIFNDLDDWYKSPEVYDLVITNACIHHFDNPLVAASQIRLKVHDRGLWFAFTEFFALDYEDSLDQLRRHRHAMLYGLYEWPYSPRMYAEAMTMSGFRKLCIAPNAAPYGRQRFKRARTLHRAFWRLLCDISLSWTVHSLLVALLSKFGRRRVRFADAAFMAFEARPIRWDRVGA